MTWATSTATASLAEIVRGERRVRLVVNIHPTTNLTYYQILDNYKDDHTMTLQKLIDELQAMLDKGIDPNTQVEIPADTFWTNPVYGATYTLNMDNKAVVIIG